MPKGSLILAAFVLFFFLFLTPVSPLCKEAKAQDCKDYEDYVPGIYLANWGIDITMMAESNKDLLDLYNWEKPDGSCTLCENPLLDGKELYLLPLAITNWKTNISCQQKVQHYVTESAISMAVEIMELSVKNDWKKELELNSSANAQWILAGSDTDLTSFIKERSSQKKYTFLLHHISCSYYKFSINKDQSVSESFKRDVQDLPEKYDSSSKLKYHHLIESYGTHYMTELDLGVRVTILTALPVCRMSLEGITVSKMSHCLEIEVGKIIGFNVTENPDFQKCKEKLQNLANRWLPQEQLRFIEGGDEYSNSATLVKGFMTDADPKEWLESVRSTPAPLSYSLESLHTLLDKGDPRKEGLRQAVNEYVRERALWMNCTDPCPLGVHECPNDNFTDSMCCPKKLGLATLTVIILRAEGLWGDYVTRTDAYVNVFFKGKGFCTTTVWNNNHPEWNENLDFGIIQLTEGSHDLEVHVWDEDYGWNDDLLGRCVLPLNIGDSTVHVCYLSHGILQYKYHLACGPHLGGPSCRDYIPLRPKNLF